MAFLVFLLVILITWVIGYIRGIQKAERQFCDRFANTKATPTQP